MDTRTPASRLTLLSALALAAALTACSRQDERTAGEKLDGAIAEAKQAGAEAKADANRAADSAEATMKGAANATSEAVTDAAIVTKINASLMADDQLKATRIDVDVRDGHVTLSGTAPDTASQRRATTLATAVDGVRSVDNKLSVARNG